MRWPAMAHGKNNNRMRTSGCEHPEDSRSICGAAAEQTFRKLKKSKLVPIQILLLMAQTR
jgi:hypothetical protein